MFTVIDNTILFDGEPVATFRKGLRATLRGEVEGALDEYMPEPDETYAELACELDEAIEKRDEALTALKNFCTIFGVPYPCD